MSDVASKILNMDPKTAAQGLLGWTLLTLDAESQQEVGGIICETEAYLSTQDPAAHNRYGKTNANASLFAVAGTLYVHSSRHHILIDIVTQDEAKPGSVLIRSLQPTVGVDIMKERRGLTDVTKLCKGPGNLCKSLGIDRSFNGINILTNDSRIKLVPATVNANHAIMESRRIGVSKDLDEALRFYIGDRTFISK